MRQFYLINNTGAVYDLNVSSVSILHSVGGLGYSDEVEYQRIGERFAAVTDYMAQGAITGVVRFQQPDAYQKYFDFVRFLQDKPLRLMVVTPVGTFYRRGTVTIVDKTEAAPLQCTVTFTATTPYYKVVARSNDGSSSGGKVYNYSYNYSYADDVPGMIDISSDSFADPGSPAKLTIFGPVENPTWRHYVDGVLVATGAVNVTVPEGRKLVINSTTIPYQIMQYDLLDNLIADDYQLSDFETERFLRLRHGFNSVTVAQDGGATPAIALEAEIEYASV